MRLRRLVYTVIMYLLIPLILYRLAVRGLRYREYFGRWRERFGFFPDPHIRDSIWVHAVSMGEVNAALPLIDALMQRHQHTPFVITTVTPTGSERVRRVYGDRVFNVYLAIRSAGIDPPIPETRSAARERGDGNRNLAEPVSRMRVERDIPLILANARLSEKSFKGYGPIRPLVERSGRERALTLPRNR